MRSTLAAGSLLVLVAVVLAGADYVLKERTITSAEQTNPNEQATSSSSAMVASSAPTIVKKGNSTSKIAGADLGAVFSTLQLIPKETSEKSLIALASAGLAESESNVLLRNNDRAFFFSVITGSSVKKVMAALKQALQEQFSANLTDLRDETITSPTGPPVDLLSFTDPNISKEPLLFLRVRDKLYELHIAENGKELLEPLVRELSK